MFKKLSALLLALCVAALPLIAACAAPESAVGSVARILCVAGSEVRGGSAVAVGPAGQPVQYFVTNNHVTTGEGTLIKVALGNSESLLNATIVESWTVPDLALIKLDKPSTEWKPIAIRSTESLKMGQRVYTITFPGTADLTGEFASSGEDASVTEGTVSSKNVDWDDAKHVRFSASLNHGSSGGALVDESGALVGLCRGSVNEFFYAINSEYIISALNAHKIPYASADSAFPLWLLILLIVVVVGALVAVILVVARRGSQPQPVAAAASGATMPVSAPRASRKAHVSSVRVTCVEGPMKGSNYSVTGTYVLGRDKSCNIIFPNDTAGVSNRHCRLTVNGSGAVLTDLQSSNGTYLADGTKLTPGSSYPLKRGDTFYLGSKSNGFMIG